jgi:hypothetical protein
MQRQIIHGVPYFVDSQNRLFTWDTETAPQQIGHYEPKSESVTYAEDHLAKLSSRLAVWRGSQQARLRKATATSSRGTARGRGAAKHPTEDPETHEE